MADKKRDLGDQAVKAAKVAQDAFEAGDTATGIAAISLAAQLLHLQRMFDRCDSLLEKSKP